MVLFGLILFIFVGCGPKVIKPGGKWIEEGWAVWYGREYHGRKTASGEVYDMYKLTAAHKQLPFGTIVKVKNLKNGQVVKVKINDRGPQERERIIDLSYQAAKEIDMLQDGMVKVRLEVVKWGK